MELVQSNINARISLGEREAFEYVYNEYYEMLLYVSMQYLKNPEDAKEAVQLAFVKFWQHRHEITEDSNIRNYLYTIVKNNSLSMLKSNEMIARNRSDIESKDLQYRYEALSYLQFDEMEFNELQNKINEAIERLPAHCQRVFRMSRFENLKYREIANRLNISEKTVESHMTKALKLLKEDLRPYLPLIWMITNLLD
ncbi:MAG: RNA polymerase sigma-70 factor [Carboxylicivirga sp.]|jgi:RNA polymerase sigma-70 factor (ECF subfamily)|nr:RNA polymerase sigma-70 factor [Carboxylicivirga sp.]